MIESPRSLGNKGFFLFILVFLVLTDLAVLLNIPILRPVLGFLFFTIIPGLLILHILKLDRLGLTERFVLSVGLSVSFLMFTGLLINSVYPLLGYTTPLSTSSVIISFSVIIIILAVIGYKRNKDSSFNLSSFKLDTREKAFLLLPAFFPLMSIFGMHLMNTTSNNTILMAMLFLIPAYVILIAILHHRVPQRIYPVMLFFIGISVLLLVALRSSHIMGNDTHMEYYLFQLVANAQHWQILLRRALDSTLSISLLPAIYQSFMDINSEYLFKILCPLLFSISPLVIYIISKKYIGNFYAFLASFLFISQFNFIWTAAGARTNAAVLFLALVIMAMFNDTLSKFAKVLLAIIFAASCIVSHYSTTYIFLFVLLLTWIMMEILSRLTRGKREPVADSVNPSEDTAPSVLQLRLEKGITITFVALFFTMLYFWYGQVVAPTFNSLIAYPYRTLVNLNQMFVMETRGTAVAEAFGQTLAYSAIPARAKFVFYWLSITFIAIGVLSTIARYKRIVSIPGSGYGKADFLERKIDAEYWVLSLACCTILVLSVALPYVLRDYGMTREYLAMMPALSIFFVIGGITVGKFLRAKPYWLLLLILIPYFICTTGTVDRIFGVPGDVVLNSEGSSYAYYYIYDQEGYAARWLQGNASPKDTMVYIDRGGSARLISQGGATVPRAELYPSLEKNREIDGYIYLTYNNVINKQIFDDKANLQNISKYEDKFIEKDKIYSNGGSEIYR